MAIKAEALEKWLEDHTLAHREKEAHKDKEHLRRKAERRKELVGQLLKEAWGRELWYDIVADASVLKEKPMTGNAWSYYILGAQAVAKGNMDWVKEFHFEQWMKMEQEARNRETEAERDKARK